MNLFKFKRIRIHLTHLMFKFESIKIFNELFGTKSGLLKVSVPAIIYVIQNNLQYYAVENLDPATFQVTYQMKILSTALFSILLLGQKLNRNKWISLLLLTCGIALIQIPTDTASSKPHTNNAKGFLAVLCACIMSGLAGVWFEKVLKGSKTSLWTRNTQLSLLSMIPALFLSGNLS